MIVALLLGGILVCLLAMSGAARSAFAMIGGAALFLLGAVLLAIKVEADPKTIWILGSAGVAVAGVVIWPLFR